MSNNVDNKKIAKNTFFLYIRMFFILALNLYISRAILDILGEIDFGIYNVVGGFVAMLGIFSNSMTAATQRFLSYEIGKKRAENVKAVFTTAVLIHLFFAVLILFFAESIGLWFVENKLNYPLNRHQAVFWVYQLSVLSFVIGLLSVPYNAALIAFEKMKAFAYVGIVEVLLKFIVVVLLAYACYDKLILYALFLALIAVAIRIVYGIYVKIYIPECKCNFKMDSSIRNNMIVFAGWNSFGSISNLLNNQGVNVLLNMFFGAAINAARGISFQVMNALQLFVANFQLAISPQIIKSFASDHKDDAFKLAFRGSRFSFLLLMVLVIPIILEAPYILKLWLIKVPDYTVDFLRIILVTALINSLGQTLSYLMQASGVVKNYQIVVGTSYMIAVPVIYVVLNMGGSPLIAMFIVLAFSQISQFCQLIMLKKSIELPVRVFFETVFLKSWVLFIMSIAIPYIVFVNLKESLLSFCIISIVSLFSSVVIAYYGGLDIGERKSLLMYIYKLKNKQR